MKLVSLLARAGLLMCAVALLLCAQLTASFSNTPRVSLSSACRSSIATSSSAAFAVISSSCAFFNFSYSFARCVFSSFAADKASSVAPCTDFAMSNAACVSELSFCACSDAILCAFALAFKSVSSVSWLANASSKAASNQPASFERA